MELVQLSLVRLVNLITQEHKLVKLYETSVLLQSLTSEQAQACSGNRSGVVLSSLDLSSFVERVDVPLRHDVAPQSRHVALLQVLEDPVPVDRGHRLPVGRAAQRAYGVLRQPRPQRLAGMETRGRLAADRVES